MAAERHKAVDYVVWKLVGAYGKLYDPKPWFCGGLFSLATPKEVARFLDKHPLVAAVVPSLACDQAPSW